MAFEIKVKTPNGDYIERKATNYSIRKILSRICEIHKCKVHNLIVEYIPLDNKKQKG